MSNKSAESLLAQYHAIAVRVDEMAQAQEAHTKRLGELAAMCRRGERDVALRELAQMDRAPRVWDYGSTVTELRNLRPKSAKLLEVKPRNHKTD